MGARKTGLWKSGRERESEIKKERDPEKEREEKEQSEGMAIIFYLRD